MTGPGQAGKSFLGFTIPALWMLFEHSEIVGVGIPDMKLAHDKWDTDFRPMIQASFPDLLPTRGEGSKEGQVRSAVTFGNGTRLRFMTPQQGDAGLAGFTVRCAILTETDKYDESSEVSREAPPIQQMEARTNHYRDSWRLLIHECTVSIPEGHIWRTITQESTDSRLYHPCPFCRAYVTWERDHLVGWHDLPDEFAARDAAGWACPHCGEIFSERERRQMLTTTVLAHQGQAVEKDGTVTGPEPRTETFGLRWSAFDNPFVSTGRLALDEWVAAHDRDQDAAERAQRQFAWAVPYEPEQLEDAPLDRKAIRKRTTKWPENVLPPDTEYFAVGIDPGRWQIWYLGLAARANGELCIVFADAQDTSLSDGVVTDAHEHIAILAALRTVADRLDAGFPIDGGGSRVPDQVWIDEGYHKSQAAVWQLCHERGTGTKGPYCPVKGIGKSSSWEARNYVAPTRAGNEVRLIDQGGRWDIRYIRARRGVAVHLDADASKLGVQAALKTPPGQPGAMSLWDAPDKRFITLSRHLASEVYSRYVDPIRGVVEEWKKSGQNHLLDCAGYALGGLWRLGYSVAPVARSEAPAQQVVIPVRPAIVQAKRQAVTPGGSWWEG